MAGFDWLFAAVPLMSAVFLERLFVKSSVYMGITPNPCAVVAEWLKFNRCWADITPPGVTSLQCRVQLKPSGGSSQGREALSSGQQPLYHGRQQTRKVAKSCSATVDSEGKSRLLYSSHLANQAGWNNTSLLRSTT